MCLIILVLVIVVCRKQYEPHAFLLDQERSSMLPVMAAGLSSIIFSIAVDVSYLNTLSRSVNVPSSSEPPEVHVPIPSSSSSSSVPSNHYTRNNSGMSKHKSSSDELRQSVPESLSLTSSNTTARMWGEGWVGFEV